jgi:pimeloyl-ACP methyl ester carboxylesterase
VLVMHGELDVVVPVDMGIAVHNAVLGPKMLLTYPDSGHLDHRRNGSFDELELWVNRVHRNLGAPCPHVWQ